MQIVSGTYKDAMGQSLAAWYTEQSGNKFNTVYTATGFAEDDVVKGVAIFTDYNKANIELHFIGYEVLTRSNIRCVARYVFEQLKCCRLTIKLMRKDKAIAKILVRLGFEYECTLKSYYGLHSDEDALVFRCMRTNAEKWMK